MWMEVKLRWRVLADRMYTKAPTGKSKEELGALLFDRAARRNHTNPYEENHIVLLQSKKSKHGGSNAKIGWHTLKDKVSLLSSTSRTC